MAYIVPNEATHAVVTTIEFSDGGKPEQNTIAFGTFDECDQCARTMPAISYSGERHAKGAHISVYPLHPLCDKCGQRHDAECAP